MHEIVAQVLFGLIFFLLGALFMAVFSNYWVRKQIRECQWVVDYATEKLLEAHRLTRHLNSNDRGPWNDRTRH